MSLNEVDKNDKWLAVTVETDFDDYVEVDEAANAILLDQFGIESFAGGFDSAGRTITSDMVDADFELIRSTIEKQLGRKTTIWSHS
jgi:hypothetical protein